VSEDYVAAPGEKEKDKQEYKCKCVLQVPEKVQDAVFYERGRTSTQELAFCVSASELSKPVAVTLDVEDCFACYDVCRLRLAAKYYRNAPVRTIRPFGLPIGPKDDPDPDENVMADEEDLIVKDPCGAFKDAFTHTATCPAP
jgi:hypothetical protein